jgi:hypothetical protein
VDAARRERIPAEALRVGADRAAQGDLEREIDACSTPASPASFPIIPTSPCARATSGRAGE